MIHPAIAIGIGLFMALCILGYGAFTGVQSDVGYGPGEDIGQSTDTVDSGYEVVDTTYSGDDIGSDLASEDF